MKFKTWKLFFTQSTQRQLLRFLVFCRISIFYSGSFSFSICCRKINERECFDVVKMMFFLFQIVLLLFLFFLLIILYTEQLLRFSIQEHKNTKDGSRLSLQATPKNNQILEFGIIVRESFNFRSFEFLVSKSSHTCFDCPLILPNLQRIRFKG